MEIVVKPETWSHGVVGMKAFVDLDGVLVDFLGGACQAHGRTSPYGQVGSAGVWDVSRLWGITDEQFWAPLASREFWSGLSWTADGPEILGILESVFGASNMVLLTAPGLTAESAAGKVDWIQRHLPTYQNRYLIGTAKHFCARAGCVLIDDRDSNLQSWQAAGGLAVQVPRPWNTGHGKTAPQSISRSLLEIFS